MQRLTEVHCSGTTPDWFRWRRRRWQVSAVLEAWRDVGQWWQGEPELWFWRVLTMPFGTMELAWEPNGNNWWLYRIYD